MHTSVAGLPGEIEVPGEFGGGGGRGGGRVEG
jgi:hypothetical protein